jgi:hypothetical protein
LATGAAFAAPVVEKDGSTATAIRGLELGSVTYDVVFTNLAPATIYDDPPTFDFASEDDAEAAIEAVSAVLNAETGIETVGDASATGVPIFRIGFGVSGTGLTRLASVWESVSGDGADDFWAKVSDPDVFPFLDDGSFADFSAVGGGEPPTEPPTPAANISKLVTEGVALGDGTLLTEILTGGGLAINLNGLVVFHGRNGDRIDGLFTQDGVVVLEGQALSDGTVVDQIGDSGGVAMNDGNQVAFLGKDDGHDEAAFTQSERLVKQDDMLGDGTVLNDIRDRGRVAMNNAGLVAFHGQSGDGLFSTTIAVFTQDNRIAAEGEILSDGTVLSEIRDVGGVAVNDFGVVAFHGRTVGADAGGEKVSAVLTQEGLVAKLNTMLPDGNVVTEIRERGRVAINVFSQVAFQGRVVDATVGADAVPAVFTSDGLVVNVGDPLSGGGALGEISEDGGVAINLFAQVAFHGRTDEGTKAVFISDGLTTTVVAKEGDTLPDGTTLDEITDTGGVAVNLFGDVVFHGRTAGVDSVFVGSQGDTAP